MRRVALLLLSFLACKSSSSDGGTDGGASSTCTCSVSVNGTEASIPCGGDSCVDATIYRCDVNAKITREGACTSPNAPPPQSACTEQPCGVDQNCPAGMRCFALDALSDTRACFPTAPILPSDGADTTCESDPTRLKVRVHCSDETLGLCVSHTCTASEQQPAVEQSRSCL